MKTCFKCKEEKNLSEFYRHSGMQDGRLNKCKDCNKLDVRKNYTKNRKHYMEHEKSRSKLPHRVLCRKKYQKTEKGKASHYKSNKKYREKYKQAARSVGKVNYAVKAGRVKKPAECSNCSSQKKIEAHHHDYSMPMEITWLCECCHKEWHRNNSPANAAA